LTGRVQGNSFWSMETIGIAIALGCDAFAVGLGVGLTCHAPRQLFRLSFHFGLFQFMMPVLGYLVGNQVAALAQTWGPIMAAAVLVFLGGHMIWEAARDEAAVDCSTDPTRGLSLVALSLATSIDALGVGFSLGLLGSAIWWPAGVIGVIAAAMTLCAMLLGSRLSQRFGRSVGIAGGIILLGIAAKFVFFN
jgi:putative Mn2+ efflux pump MntP